MRLINTTRMVAGYNVGLEPDGREVLVVVVKGTFVMPKGGGPMVLHDEQLPLIMADTFTGEPGESSPHDEVDFAPRKERCDVLLTGHARAPAGKSVTRLRVGLRAGSIDKSFDVVGDRVWRFGPLGIAASSALPFERMPISYDVAFGGTHPEGEGDGAARLEAYALNPVGRGWHRTLSSDRVHGRPLPNCEETGKVVRSPDQTHRPMAFGPLGRGWAQRARFAGTYDARWRRDCFPFLPDDFDPRYYQAAPEDQQIPFPEEPLPVVLTGLCDEGDRTFVVPRFEAPVRVIGSDGAREHYKGALDTIVMQPDHERLTLTWRVTRPLRRSIFEVAEVRVGLKSREPFHAPPANDGRLQSAGPSSR